MDNSIALFVENSDEWESMDGLSVDEDNCYEILYETQEKEDSDTNLNTDPETCPICLEYMGDDIYETFCGHLFHKDCVKTWFNKVGRVECPACRQMDMFDSDVILRTEQFLNKLSSCHNVKNFELENLREFLKSHNMNYLYSKNIQLILDGEDDYVKVILAECLQSLCSRHFLEKVGNEYHYVA